MPSTEQCTDFSDQFCIQLVATKVFELVPSGSCVPRPVSSNEKSGMSEIRSRKRLHTFPVFVFCCDKLVFLFIVTASLERNRCRHGGRNSGEREDQKEHNSDTSYFDSDRDGLSRHFRSTTRAKCNREARLRFPPTRPTHVRFLGQKWARYSRGLIVRSAFHIARIAESANESSGRRIGDTATGAMG